MVAIITSDLFDEDADLRDLLPDPEPLGSRTAPRSADPRPGQSRRDRLAAAPLPRRPRRRLGRHHRHVDDLSRRATARRETAWAARSRVRGLVRGPWAPDALYVLAAHLLDREVPPLRQWQRHHEVVLGLDHGPFAVVPTLVRDVIASPPAIQGLGASGD